MSAFASEIGTKRPSRSGLAMSVDWARPEVALRGRQDRFWTHSGSRGRRRAAYTIVISRLSWGAKTVLGISAWTPRTMSTTWVTRKLTATLHSA